MIKQARVTNYLGEFITLDLKSPSASGLFVKNIDGLDPGKATINVADISNADGSIYNSSRLGFRNIVLSLGFLPNPTIEDTRQNLYKYFPIKSKINIEVETDNRLCQVDGYVESNDINIFSKEEGAIISVVCPEAYLRSAVKNITLLSGMEDMFEFPFSNESLSENLIIFGNSENVREGLIEYTGDVPIGIEIYIHAVGTVTHLRIANLSNGELMDIDDTKLTLLVGSGIIAGDDIVISTIKGEKFIKLTRNVVDYDILYALGDNPDWFQLNKGDNIFTYLADSGLSNLDFRIENLVAYEGV